jgi:hypothetical protein
MITPMKRFNTNFRILKSLLTEYEYFTLNKTNIKSIPYPFSPIDRVTGDRKSYTKGVKNDFLLIFNKIDADLSIGFAINYLKDFENPTFIVTIKFGGSNELIQSSNEMDMNEFICNLNMLNRDLRNKKDALQAISLNFFDEKYNLEKHYTHVESEVEDLMGEEYVNYMKLKENYNKELKSTSDKKNEISKKLSMLVEHKEVERLKKLLVEAQSKLEVKAEEFQKKSNIGEIELVLEKKAETIKQLGWNLTSRLRKLKGKYPIFIGDKIKEMNK